MWNLVGIFLIIISNQVQALCNCEEELARFKNEFKAEVKAEIMAEIKAGLDADLKNSTTIKGLDYRVTEISNSNQEIVTVLQSHDFKLTTHEKTLNLTQELITETIDFDEEIQHLTTLSKVY